MIQLKGMTWDHVRGIAPLKEATKHFKQMNPTVEIIWDARSLKDFEDFPLESLADQYDFLLVDHPFIGTGVSKNILTPLDDYLPESYLLDQKQNSVGKSFSSYTWENKQWALAVDAASQVAVYREDLLSKLNLQVPDSWEDVIRLIKELPGNYKVGIPLNPTHCFLSFLALCVNHDDEGFWTEEGINPDAAAASLHLLRTLTPLLHSSSLDVNPIQMSEAMASEGEIVYSPLMFGYVSYARKEFTKRVLRFTDIPSAHPEPKGGILGGVGLAISAYSKHKEVASEFVKLVGSENFQVGPYFESGGQPGHRRAWEAPAVNDCSNYFFKNTLRSLDYSYLRPRFSGYPLFQEKVGYIINEYLKKGGNTFDLIHTINNLYREFKMVAT
ncbi:ABC transporter substrate-binding protein [Bacillus salipaludis]|uniref:ABC transporter substrate-binding protein n=1 Tax=Bacillus salipaludis TaxID=2547811 RepID=A0ABW8RLX9_9BACI